MVSKENALRGWSRLLLDIFILVMGIVMCTGAPLSGDVAEIILGVLFIFYGTVMIGTGERDRGAGEMGLSRIGLVCDILWMVLGILCLITAHEVEGTSWAFKLLIAVWMIVTGLWAWLASRADNYQRSSRLSMYLAIAEVVLGVLVLCTMAAPEIVAGIFMIIFGAIAILMCIRGWRQGR